MRKTLLQGLCATVLLLVAFSALPVRAATTVVSSLADSGAGSLRQAILDAAPGDTIDVTATGTIILTSGTLEINGNLTINGPGASSLAISGNNSSRVFIIGGGVSVAISGVTIRDGHAPGCGFAGGLNNFGTLVLTNTAVSANTGDTSGCSAGGGIYNTGTLTLIGSTVSGNAARWEGAGINNSGTVTVINTTISGNYTIAFDIQGISNSFHGTLNVINSTIADNFGTGILNDSGTVTVKNTILKNSANCNINSGTIDLCINNGKSYCLSLYSRA